MDDLGLVNCEMTCESSDVILLRELCQGVFVQDEDHLTPMETMMTMISKQQYKQVSPAFCLNLR